MASTEHGLCVQFQHPGLPCPLGELKVTLALFIPNRVGSDSTSRAITLSPRAHQLVCVDEAARSVVAADCNAGQQEGLACDATDCSRSSPAGLHR